LHKKITANGWTLLRTKGNHYIYSKNGIESPPVPFHHKKEVGVRLLMKITQDMKLKK
jgi:predicted RNA binding protein YcfA (HicA-like mRNA interferase family)